MDQGYEDHVENEEDEVIADFLTNDCPTVVLGTDRIAAFSPVVEGKTRLQFYETVRSVVLCAFLDINGNWRSTYTPYQGTNKDCPCSIQRHAIEIGPKDIVAIIQNRQDTP